MKLKIDLKINENADINYDELKININYKD